jgi:hypothetical protein
MGFQRTHDSFQSIIQWHIWRLGLDLADYTNLSLPGHSDTAGLTWYRFYQDFLMDLYTIPQAYGISHEQYETYVPGDKAQEDRVRASRLRVRKAIEVGYLEFLYQLGQVGEVDGQMLKVARPFFEQLVAEKTKKTKIKHFTEGFSRLGWKFDVGDNVVVRNLMYPGLLDGLSAFAKECALNSEFGFYFFRRCDLDIFTGKMQPIFNDALRLAPESMQTDLKGTDRLLLENNFKREIFVADAGAGYRLRYSKKHGKIVYWCRVMNSYQSDLNHNLRWEINSVVTPMLFRYLSTNKPDLDERIFKGIKKCAHCYEPCMARAIIKRNGQEIECCQEAGWEISGASPADIDDLRTVICILVDLVNR